MKASGGLILVIVGLLLLYLVMSDKYVLLEDFAAGLFGQSPPSGQPPQQGAAVALPGINTASRARQILNGQVIRSTTPDPNGPTIDIVREPRTPPFVGK
jgi:hypothetical protein